MTISLTGNGSLFKRLGHLFGLQADVLSIIGDTATTNVTSDASVQAHLNLIETDYTQGTRAEYILEDLYSVRDSFRSAQQAILTSIGKYAENTIIEMAHADVPLTTKDLRNALIELIKQMNASSDDVNRSSVSAGAQTAVGSPTGTPIVVASVKGGDGLDREYVFPEKIYFKCVGDSANGTGTAKQEPFEVKGEAAQTDVWAYDWPNGSGSSVNFNLVDATQNNDGNTLLQNGDFETTTTANHPDNWTRVTGSIGTTIINGGASHAYTGSGSLAFVGDAGATLMQMTQTFNTTPSTTADAGGTSATLKSNTQYAVNFWVKVSATPAAGTLIVDLYDGSAVIADDQSANNSVSKDLTAVSTTWVNVNGVFRTPKVLPTTIKLRVRLSVAIDNGKTVYIDRIALHPMTELYTGGPYFSIFSGATNPNSISSTGVPDMWTVTISNTYGSFQKYFERNFGMRALGLQLPSDGGGTETIADSLIA